MAFRSMLLLVLATALFAGACGPSEIECPPGSPDCPCLSDGACEEAIDGSAWTCIAGTCRQCEAGRDGCGCMAGESCLPGLDCSEEGICSYPPGAFKPPPDPKCYTPCSGGVTLDDGTYRSCSAQGLMEGCVDGLVCEGGSCVIPGAVPAVCRSQVGCPDYQTCLGGSCYSNCEFDVDCPSGTSCFRKACRARCTTSDQTCEDGYFCSTSDGVSGYCMPLGPPTGRSQTEVAGTFAVDRANLEFSNVNISEALVIVNESPASEVFTLRKLEHREFTSEGFTIITESPLHWLTMGSPEQQQRVEEYSVRIDGGDKAIVQIGDAYNSTLDRWEGVIEIRSDSLGVRRLGLSYMGKPEGQWAGRMVHFASFPDSGLEAWSADKSNPALLRNVGNAFIHRWTTFKMGGISYDELKAVIDSTINETWKWPSMDRYCPDPNKACYPYDNLQGFAVYSDPLSQYPIPSAANELPFVMNLREDPEAGDPAVLSGRIVSSKALQYAGDPELRLRFAQDPAICEPNSAGVVVCDITRMEADILIGGRYLTTGGDSECALTEPGTFVLSKTPWLLPGFQMGTESDASGRRHRYECRDKMLPFQDPGVMELNQALATSNPIPDGRTRRRRLEIIDGALIDAREIVLIFRESFESFLGGTDTDGFSSYGLMILRRGGAQLSESDWEGSSALESRAAPEGALSVGCSSSLLERALGTSAFPTDPGRLNDLAGALIDGVIPGPAPVWIQPDDTEKAHYLCEDTGLFNAGSLREGIKVACPAESRVRYFVVLDLDDQDLAALPCQQSFSAGSYGTILETGTCQTTLNEWAAAASHGILLDPVWRCANANEAYCSYDREDLRQGKYFFLPQESAAVFLPLRSEVEDAFRYKTRFRNRQGRSVGFAPQICVPNSNSVPYCYDPAAIETVQERIDCAVAVYTGHLDELTTANKISLHRYLLANFAFEQEIDPQNQIVVYDGFERMNAELLIMMGDESYTAAHASRFDLSGSSLRSFEGSLFEPGGINLSGGAGFEMVNLYQAVQYYQAALDRFYALSPLLWDSIDVLGPDDGFITTHTVVTYFDRLIRASSQKARAWSEVAKRYQSFNRPDLARLVIERAYTSAYLESVVLSRLMLKLEAVVLPEDRPQLVNRVELAQLTYRSALLAMRDGYAAISDNPTLFGFMPDYVPFPALGDDDTNAFEMILESAYAKLAVAGDKEERALASTRSYETDAAVFQSELVSIRNNYENRLAQLCGTFIGDDHRVYPAIPRYAYLNAEVALIGNPCGFVGNGEIHNAMASSEIAALDLKRVIQAHDNIMAEIDSEELRLSDQCGQIGILAASRIATGSSVQVMNGIIRTAQLMMAGAKRLADLQSKAAETRKCLIIGGTAAGSDCPLAIVAAAEITIGGVILETAMQAGENLVAGLQQAIELTQFGQVIFETYQQCTFAQIESAAKVRSLALGLQLNQLEAIKQMYAAQQAESAIIAMRNEAMRVMAEQEETEQLTINIEAARNDPNVRIYKNDAVLAADRTFHSALREAYRATKVYEYYTSQCYARRDDLFLVRMIGYGDQSLESYMAELTDAFYAFEERYGHPDTRVALLSLREDILAIPRLGEAGQPLSEEDRLVLLRAALRDVSRLDENGYLTIPFSTRFDVLSPLTGIHKVRAIEVEIIGSDVGDLLGRVYLRQSGTGVVRSLDAEKSYYGFPGRTAVINTFFNGEKVFADAVYRNLRLRDRPFVNTHWELVINQKDEWVNKDVNLGSLADVRLYVTYTDFTR